MFSLAVSVAAVVVLTLLLLMIVIAYIRTGVPTVMSPRAAQRLTTEILSREKAQTIYELGSGKGDFVLTIAKTIPEARVYGFELSPAPYLIARLRAFASPVRKHIHFLLRDFKKTSLQSADAVVFYLMLHANKKIAPKLERELAPGTLVISISFSIADWRPERVYIADNWTKTRVLVYRMPVQHKPKTSAGHTAVQSVK